MSKQKQTVRAFRGRHQRYGAMLFAMLTVVGAAAMSKDSRNFYKEVTTNPAYAFSQLTERENETARIPVRFDVGLHAPYMGGS